MSKTIYFIVGLITASAIATYELLSDRLDRLQFEKQVLDEVTADRSEADIQKSIAEIANLHRLQLLDLEVAKGRARQGNHARDTDLAVMVPVTVSISYQQDTFYFPSTYNFTRQKLVRLPFKDEKPSPALSH